MDVSLRSKKADQLSLGSTAMALARHYLGGRRGLIALAVIALGAGLISSWGWLVAAGIAPLLLALAPCAAMCALGLCPGKMGGKSCSTPSDPADEAKKTAEPITLDAAAIEATTVARKTSDETAAGQKRHA
jgi:hypothetical protein